VKTPCLKCGLIHDDATAICDGYAGIDPDETASDTRKKAAERIRAVLAAVPIESRRPARARAAAAGAGASASESTAAMRAAMSGSMQGDPAAAGPAEVPEWRREVTERLETYRNRRARQSRQASNQTILGFRVHSKTDSLEQAEESPVAAAPALDAASAVSETLEAAPASVPMAAASVAASAVASESAATTSAEKSLPRVYAADETDLTESLSEYAFADDVEAPERDPEEVASDARAIAGSLPIAAEPAVVLADSATLEVHADPGELPLSMEDDEETARLSPVASAQIAALATAAPISTPAPAVRNSKPATAHVETDSAPLAVIPAIDKDYWHAAPVAGTADRESSPEAEELECGSLTSGFDSPVAGIEKDMEEEFVPTEEAVSAGLPSKPSVASEPSLAAAPGEPAQLPTEEAPALLPEYEEPATEALAAAENTSESLSRDAIETPETEEIDDRRAALRTAARPQPGGVPERIEISVPQPVFDFTVTHPQNEQPHDDALPVADLRERRRASFIDATVLAFTIVGFFLAFHMAGGEFSYSRVGAAVGVAAAFLIYAQYILLFTLVGGATPGMVLRGLRVVCFDGRSPDAFELAWRAFGYLLSAAAGMLGFLWSAWDEHGLSWHDRISQTYITYTVPEGEPLVATMQ